LPTPTYCGDDSRLVPASVFDAHRGLLDELFSIDGSAVRLAENSAKRRRPLAGPDGSGILGNV